MKFDLHKSFQHGRQFIHAGIYRIPQDLAEEVAAKAFRNGIGEWIREVAPKAISAAPQNTALSVAPENKAGGMAPPATFPDAHPVQGMGKNNRRGKRTVADA